MTRFPNRHRPFAFKPAPAGFVTADRYFNALWLLAALLALSGITIQARADDEAVRKELRAKTAGAIQALKKKDLKTYTEMWTPDFTYRQPDGKVLSRKQLEQQVRQQMATMKSIDITFTLQRLTVTRGGAITVGSQKASMRATDQSGRVHKVDLTRASKTTWVKSGRDWKVKRIEVLGEKVLVDGVVVNPYGKSTNK